MKAKGIAQLISIILANILFILLIRRFAGDSADTIITYTYGLITILFVIFLPKLKK